MELKPQAISGVKWTTSSMLIVTLLQFAQLTILARLLDPTDFGLMAVMMVVIGFSQAFQDMGMSNAIIQNPLLSHTQLSSLYWLNIASGLALSLIVLAISPLIADFYDEPRISWLMAIFSSVFLIIALGNQFRILFQKNLQFRFVEIVDVCAAISAFSVAIFFAANGHGVLALIYAVLTQASVASLLFLYLGLKFCYKPSFVYRHSELKKMYAFGLYQMGERSINYVGANADKLLIGKILGMNAVGFYNLAWQLIIFPLTKINPIVNKVAFPIYSRIYSNSESLERYYSLSIKVLSLLTMPLFSFLIFFSEEIVLIIFGSGWSTTADLLPLLAWVGIAKALGNPGGAVVLASGRAEVSFWWNVVWGSAIVISLVVGLTVSPSVYTAAYILVGLSATLGVCWHIVVSRIANIRYLPIASHLSQVFCTVLIIGWLGHSVVLILEIENPLLRVIVGGAMCGLTYVIYLISCERKLLNALAS